MFNVWVTRVADDPDDLVEELRRLNLTPIIEPVLQYHAHVHTLDGLEFSAQDWLVLTSPYSIRLVAEHLKPFPSRTRVAVVGAASRDLAVGLGFNVKLISPSGEADGLWQALRPLARGTRIYYPRSSVALLPRMEGLEVISPVLYSVENRRFALDVVMRSNIATFTSASAVASSMSQLRRLDLPVASIGPKTTTALRSCGIRTIIEAPERSLKSMAREISRFFKLSPKMS